MNIQYKGKIIRIRIILALLLTLGILMHPVIAKAEENLSDAEIEERRQNGVVVENSRNKVVKIRITFRPGDKKGDRKSVRFLTGFMIGDGGQTTHVITSNKGLHASAEELNQWKNEWTEEDGKVPEIGDPTIEIILSSGDIKNANIASENPKAGIAVLTLAQPINANFSMVLGDGKIAVDDPVWLCTFPDTDGENLDFSEKNMYHMRGKFLMQYGAGEEALLEYDIRPDLYQGAGSPVLDKTGSVVGVHIGLNEKGNGTAVGIEAVRQLLEQDKISYRSYKEPEVKPVKKTLPIVLGVIAGLLLILSIIQIIRGFVRKGNYVRKDPDHMPRLVRVSSGETILINKVPFCLGSSKEGTDYTIPENRKISRKHALVVGGPNQFMLVDLSSSNGTSLNGGWLQPEAQYQLHHGDTVWLADEEFIFLQG